MAGVYISEVAGPRPPLKGVATSVIAFVGPAPGGPVGTQVRVTSWDAFELEFGSPQAGAFLPYAVHGFFGNGGTEAWIVRAESFEGLSLAAEVTCTGPGSR